MTDKQLTTTRRLSSWLDKLEFHMEAILYQQQPWTLQESLKEVKEGISCACRLPLSTLTKGCPGCLALSFGLT